MQLQGSTAQDFELQSRVSSWMAAMYLASGEMGAAESYLLNLLAWRTFGDRTQEHFENMS